MFFIVFYIELYFSRCFLEGKWKFLCQINYRNASYFKQVTSRWFIMSIQFSSVAQSYPTPFDPMDCSTRGLPVHHQLSKFTQTHVRWVDFAIQPSHPLFPVLLLPLIFSSIRVFSNQSVLPMRRPKYWSFNFSISLSNDCSRLISFRIGWFDFLAIQVTLKSLLHTTVQKHQFFNIQPSLWSSSHIHTWPLEKL